MRISIVLPILILGGIVLGLTFNDANAELSANNAFILEGAGFAVTEESIKTTEIDFSLSTGDKSGSRMNFVVEDGFVTLSSDDFIVSDLTGTALRDGRFIRISGTVEDFSGNEVSLRIFGRLIQNSNDDSVYFFNGRLTHDGETHKIIYTTKLSGLTSTLVSDTNTTKLSGLTSTLVSDINATEKEGEIVVRISLGASDQGFGGSYIDLSQFRSHAAKAQGDLPLRARYFSLDRISIEPGASVTFTNDDNVTHRVVSGTGLGPHSGQGQGNFVICETPPKKAIYQSNIAILCDFTFDGRIDSGVIEPGESWTVSFDDSGFYRIIDPDYPWISIVVYSFPETDSIILNRLTDNPNARAIKPKN